MKTCPRCGVEKPLDEFNKRRGGTAPSSYCKPCTREYSQAWQAQDPNNTRSRQQKYMRKYLYGLSEEQQDALPKECAICYTTENLHVDHDHNDGLVRGVLCRDHNMGLGRFQDSPTLLLRAVDYLRAHESEGGD